MKQIILPGPYDFRYRQTNCFTGVFHLLPTYCSHLDQQVMGVKKYKYICVFSPMWVKPSVIAQF